MVKKSPLFQKALFYVLLSVSSLSAYADPLLDGPDTPPDTAPIDDYLIIVAFAAVLFGLYFIKTKLKKASIE